MLRPGTAGVTVVMSLPLLRRPGTVGPIAVELATGNVWTPGAGSTSNVGTRRVVAVKLTTQTSPVGNRSVPSPPGGTKR